MDWINVGNQVLLYAMFALSLNLLMGYAGQASIAHAAFGAVGGYTVGKLGVTFHWNFVPAVIVAVIIAFVVGALVALPALRLPSEYIVLLTIAVAYIVSSLITSIDSLGGQYGLQSPGRISLFGWELTTQRQIMPLFAVIGILVFFTCWRMGESAFGRVLRSLREDEAATKALGKDTVRFKMVVFGATSAVAGLAGALLVYYYQIVSPAQWTVNQAITMIAIVVLGGTGNLLGSLLGAVLVTASTPVLQNWVHLGQDKATFAQLIIYGGALILLMMFRPEGIFRERHSGERRLDRARADAASATGSMTREMAATSATRSVGAAVNPLGDSGNGATPTGKVAVKVTGLRKSFGGIRAVQGVDLELPENEVTALIGPNGAGKSTLFNLFTGFIPPDEGTVTLHGEDIRGLAPNVIAGKGLVRSFQDVRLFTRLTAFENVLVGVPGQAGERLANLFVRPGFVARSDRESMQKAIGYLELVGMQDKAHVLAADLAHGEQKLVAIARVLATGADVLLLDEPTSGVDPAWVDRVADTIRMLPSLGKTVCIVEHNLHFLERLDVPCYFLEYGSVRTHGVLRELMADDELRHAYFGV